MHNKTHFTIVGTGAVGGFYGALLQKADFHVNFLLNTDYNYVKENGLTIESTLGDFALPEVNAYNDPKEIPASDVVIIALKTTANHHLKDILPHITGDQTIVLTLQNGLGSEEEIAPYANPDHIIGGLCFLCSNKVGPGHIRHLDYGLITLGEYRADGSPGGITPRLQKLGDELSSAGIPIRLVEDLSQARWKKLVWNIPFNGLSVAENKLTDKLIKEPKTRKRCITMMHEVAEASAACSRPIEPEFIEKMITDTEKMEPYAPSMKLDYDRNSTMEIEAIYGTPLRIAEAAGIDMPETRKLYEQLKDLQL